jgi:hypothetical protein
MQVGSICNADAAPDPPRTPPREEAGANENPSEINDNAEENGATQDEDEDESASVVSEKRRRVRRKWSVLGDWDAGQLLASVIDANILWVATERMEESGLQVVEHKGKTDQVHRSMVSVQVVCQGFGTNISRDILLPTQQSHQMSHADPRHSVLDHSHSRKLRRRAFAGSLSRTRPVQKTQLQAADSSRQGCENQSKNDADRCPQGAPSSQSERQNHARACREEHRKSSMLPRPAWHLGRCFCDMWGCF